MKTIEETYRERLKLLTEKHGGQVGLSQLIDKSPAQISQWINAAPNTGNGKPRSMKPGTAREIEQALGLPHAWFDQPITAETAVIGTPVREGYLQFKLLDVKAASGQGKFSAEYPEVISMVEVSQDWADKHLGRNIKNISVITAHGDSMEPTFHNGDLLFVDTEWNYFSEDGIYVFTATSGLKVKRLQGKMNGELIIHSDNSRYISETLSTEDLSTIHICGKVIATMKLEKL